MTVIAFVPVRIGSKGIPKKNIKPFCGKPLVYWTLKAAQEAKGIDRIVVASDSEEINQVVREFSFDKVEIFNRSPENANDTASTESVMLEYLNTIDNEGALLLLQATSPLTRAEDIDGAINLWAEDKTYSVLSAVNIKRFFWNSDGTPKNYDPFNRPRRQDFTGDWAENGAIYIQSIQGIKDNQNRLSTKTKLYQMPEHTFVELDSSDDWIICEQLMMHHENNR